MILHVLHCLNFVLAEKIRVLCNLGSTYTYLCNFPEAENCFTQALVIGKQSFDDSSKTWRVLKPEIFKRRGVMKRKKGEADVALTLLKESAKMKKPQHNGLSNLHQLGKEQCFC